MAASCRDSADARPVIAITMGDPAGIGAELAVKALADPEIYGVCKPFVIGDSKMIADALRFTGSDMAQRRIAKPDEGMFEPGTIDIVDLDNIDMNEHAYGRVSGSAGRAAFDYIRTGIELAMAGEADAVVTGPIHKESLNRGGYKYSGHTEIFADLTGTRDYAMMLVDQGMRVVHVTTHVSLRKACDLIKKDRVLTVIRLAHDAALRLGVAEPQVGIAGLNPHSGEEGLFGTEEIEEIRPAIDAAREEGIDAEGPVPPDTLFAKARGGQYDIVVAMYHDQGHIPLKTVSFALDQKTGKWLSVSGVNTTLGLPIIRTSVDHGVAFGKAGKGAANPESLVQAIHLAVQLAHGRNGEECTDRERR